MSYQVLARKYRPNSFDEVIGQDHVVQVIKNSIEQERVHQAFLFSGTRGVGKTTIARLLAKCLNCMSSDSPTSQPCNKCESSISIQEGKSIDFLEIDAASRTGVEHMRELLSSVHTSPSVSRFKIFLIDEVHMLSKGSFNALLKTLEEPPSHVIFLMATTDPEKVPKTVISRCLQLNLKTVSRDELQEHFKKICVVEDIADQWSIENSNIFQGYFHILGGTISSSTQRKEDLLINSLVERVKRDDIEEVILATSATVEGQTTAFYIQESLKKTKAKITRLAQGLPVGGEIETLDDGTLFSAFKNRSEINSN